MSTLLVMIAAQCVLTTATIQEGQENWFECLRGVSADLEVEVPEVSCSQMGGKLNEDLICIKK